MLVCVWHTCVDIFYYRCWQTAKEGFYLRTNVTERSLTLTQRYVYICRTQRYVYICRTQRAPIMYPIHAHLWIPLRYLWDTFKDTFMEPSLEIPLLHIYVNVPYMYGTCMVHVWYIYGTCMVHIWYMYGTCMVHVWHMYGTCMVHVWYMYGTCMVHVCRADGN